MTARKGGLGRGLSALIPGADEPASDARIPVTEVAIDDVLPNPQQPRLAFRQAELDELAASIRAHGVIQPLLVSEQRADDGTARYQLIAGERRLRAARSAGLTRVPVTIRQSTPQELLELALIENLQREDLNPLEEALAYQRLVDDFALTQQAVAQRVGRSRTAVANTMRLLELPAELRASLAAGEISEGHGRALLGIADAEARRAAWREVVDRGLNVRQTEALVRRARAPQPGAPRAPRAPRIDADLAALTDSLRRALGTKVTLRRNRKGAGALTLHFFSDEELEGVLERLLGPQR